MRVPRPFPWPASFPDLRHAGLSLGFGVLLAVLGAPVLCAAVPGAADSGALGAARARLDGGDALGATQLALPELSRSPDSSELLALLAEAYLALGDADSALAFAERAAHLEPKDAQLQALRGDALNALSEEASAREAYAQSLQLRHDPAVARKLASLPPGPSSARLRLRYEGGIDAPVGAEVMRILGAAYDEFSQRLGFHPSLPVTVTLLTQESFEDSRVPAWAEGVNDGTIRIPVRGLEEPSPRLRAVLRHELAHSFVTERTGGNCPAWIQEGVAQWLEGGDPAREDARLAAALMRDDLPPLLSLEAPFSRLSEESAALAYAESLGAVAHLLQRHGEAGLRRLLTILGEGRPSERALPAALGVDYVGFQRSFEKALRSRR